MAGACTAEPLSACSHAYEEVVWVESSSFILILVFLSLRAVDVQNSVECVHFETVLAVQTYICTGIIVSYLYELLYTYRGLCG